MRKLFAVSVSALFLMGLALAQDMSKDKDQDKSHHMSRSSAGVQQSLMEMEKKWSEAGKANDPAALDGMLADNFVNLDSDGSVHSKAETLSRMKKAKWETNEVSDMKVTESGDTAIVTGTWRGKGMDGMGKGVDGSERFVDTWRKMPDGKWKCIASASAPVKQEQSGKK